MYTAHHSTVKTVKKVLTETRHLLKDEEDVPGKAKTFERDETTKLRKLEGTHDCKRVRRYFVLEGGLKRCEKRHARREKEQEV